MNRIQGLFNSSISSTHISLSILSTKLCSFIHSKLDLMLYGLYCIFDQSGDIIGMEIYITLDIHCEAHWCIVTAIRTILSC